MYNTIYLNLFPLNEIKRIMPLQLLVHAAIIGNQVATTREVNKRKKEALLVLCK